MTRHGNSFYFEAEEEMALMSGVKRFKINATTTAYAHSQYGQIEAVGANAATEIEKSELLWLSHEPGRGSTADAHPGAGMGRRESQLLDSYRNLLPGEWIIIRR